MAQPMSPFDHYERGRVLKQSHMFEEALEEFRHAVTDPVYAGKARVQIALCLRATGRYDEATTAFRQALELATFSSVETTHIQYLLGRRWSHSAGMPKRWRPMAGPEKRTLGSRTWRTGLNICSQVDAARSPRINKTTSPGSKTCADGRSNSRLRFSLCWTSSGNR